AGVALADPLALAFVVVRALRLGLDAGAVLADLRTLAVLVLRALRRSLDAAAVLADLILAAVLVVRAHRREATPVEANVVADAVVVVSAGLDAEAVHADEVAAAVVVIRARRLGADAEHDRVRIRNGHALGLLADRPFVLAARVRPLGRALGAGVADLAALAVRPAQAVGAAVGVRTAIGVGGAGLHLAGAVVADEVLVAAVLILRARPAAEGGPNPIDALPTGLARVRRGDPGLRTGLADGRGLTDGLAIAPAIQRRRGNALPQGAGSVAAPRLTGAELLAVPRQRIGARRVGIGLAAGVREANADEVRAELRRAERARNLAVRAGRAGPHPEGARGELDAHQIAFPRIGLGAGKELRRRRRNLGAAARVSRADEAFLALIVVRVALELHLAIDRHALLTLGTPPVR